MTPLPAAERTNAAIVADLPTNQLPVSLGRADPSIAERVAAPLLAFPVAFIITDAPLA